MPAHLLPATVTLRRLDRRWVCFLEPTGLTTPQGEAAARAFLIAAAARGHLVSSGP